MTKRCFKCKRVKPARMFYRHSQMGDGLLGKCKACTKKDVMARYYREIDKIREYERKRWNDPERRAKVMEYQKARRVRHPGKNKARTAVGNAIRDGRMQRLSCEVCGSLKSQAHHPDYRRWNNIRWLCFKHHREVHGQLVRT